MLLALSARVGAQPEGRAVIWYRSTEGCADGPSFLARLGERSALVRLAEAGDQVDFVVVVAITPQGAIGRVERQIRGGTVAIREVHDQSCDRVVDVLALHLALALEPEHGSTPTTAEPAPDRHAGDPTALAPPVRSDAGPAAQPPILPASEPAVREPMPGVALEPEHVERRPATAPLRWRVGIQGGAVTGVTPIPLARASTFVHRDVLPNLATRLAVVGLLGSPETAGGEVRHWVLAGRLELCPFRVAGPRLSLAPCAAADLGATSVSGYRRDVAAWVALGAHGRGTWQLGGPVALEAELGALFPLTRYEVFAGSELLYESAPVGLSAGLGASVGFP
jgi:hypothetical protein